MTRDQLEHAIRAACDIAGDTELWVFGSQAILGEYPSAPENLRSSIEVDVQPKNCPEAADEIDGALGEASVFHATHGFYVHGLLIEPTAFPEGWQERAVPVRSPGTNDNTGWCLEAHDLAAGKLCAYREKDREFVRTLLVEDIISVVTLKARIRDMTVAADLQERLLDWIDITVEELKRTE